MFPGKWMFVLLSAYINYFGYFKISNLSQTLADLLTIRLMTNPKTMKVLGLAEVE